MFVRKCHDRDEDSRGQCIDFCSFLLPYLYILFNHQIIETLLAKLATKKQNTFV